MYKNSFNTRNNFNDNCRDYYDPKSNNNFQKILKNFLIGFINIFLLFIDFVINFPTVFCNFILELFNNWQDYLENLQDHPQNQDLFPNSQYYPWYVQEMNQNNYSLIDGIKCIFKVLLTLKVC